MKVGGLIVLCVFEIVPVALELPKVDIGENGLGIADPGNGTERLLGAVSVEEGTGRFAKGLKRGESSLEAAGRDFTFFSRLAFVGLSIMFLNIFDVLDPPVVSLFDLAIFIRLPSCPSLSSSSFVN